MVGDFDGDGRRRPHGSPDTPQVVSRVLPSLVPLVGNQDRDFISDYIIWRPTTGVWFTAFSGSGSAIVGCGIPGDKPAGRVPGS